MDIKVLITEQEIASRTRELAEQIQREYNNEEIVIVCILKGATFFAVELAKRIESDTIIDFMKVSSYEGTESTGKINFTLDISEDITGKNVLIVEDIVDTGRTLAYVKKYLESKNPKNVKICTMLNKKERRVIDLEPEYVAFNIPDKFVIGYGLDYDEKYRNLPYVGYLE